MKRILILSVALGLAACGEESAPSVHSFTPSSNPLLSNGRPADGVLGQEDFLGITAGTTNAAGTNFSAGGAVATTVRGDRTLEVWVADRANRRVLGFARPDGADFANGVGALTVIGQPDFVSSDTSRLVPSNFDPVALAIDPEFRLYVVSNNRVLVYEDPRNTDRLHDYELDFSGIDFSDNITPVTDLKGVEIIRESRVAVFNDTSIFYFRTGNPARITDPDALDSPPCAPSVIAGVAASDDNFFVACQSVAGTCFSGVPDPNDCVAGSVAASSCFPAAECGGVYAYRYVRPVDNTEPEDPNAGLQLPLAPSPGEVDVPVFSGFGLINDIYFEGSALFVSDAPQTTVGGGRVLRLGSADTAAIALLADPTTGNDIVERFGTQNVWTTAVTGGLTTAGSNPSVDVAFGQSSPRSYGANRGIQANLNLTAASLGSGFDLAVEASTDTLWVVDSSNNRLLRYASATGAANTSANLVLGQPSFAPNFANAIEGTGFGQVFGIAFHRASNTLYVSDERANRVLVFDSFGNGASATDALGQPDLISFQPNQAITLSAQTLNGPTGVFVDQANGDLIINDTGNSRGVRIEDPSASATPARLTFAAPNSSQPGETNNFGVVPFGAVASRGGDFYISVNGAVHVYSGSGDDESRRFGDGASIGPNGISGTVGGLALNSAGTVLYVADTDNHRILVFDNPDGADVLEATTADFVIGQPNFFFNAPAILRDGLQLPTGLAVDGQGRLWVADSGNNRVLLFANPRELNENGRVDASFVLGQPDFTSGGVNAGPDGVDERSLFNPTAIATNEAGDVVFVADQGHNRVLRFTDAPRLVFSEGPGVYDVPQGGTQSINIVTTIDGAELSANSTSPAATLNGAAVVFNATGLAVGSQARVDVTARVAGPPEQRIQGAVTFKVIQGATESTATPPAPTNPPPREESGCTCNGIQAPWLAGLGIFALWRRQRRRKN